MNDNFTKIIALSIVGGVAKTLFAAPRPTPTNTIINNAAEKAMDRLEYKDLGTKSKDEDKA